MLTKKETVLDRLRRQKAAEGVIDGQAMREEWMDAIHALMSLLGSWLGEAVQEGLFTVNDEVVERTEQRLGTYEVPALRLTTPRGETIRITPKARQVAGGDGRVDLESPPKKLILMRVEPDCWQFARLAPQEGGWVTQDLTEESFWQAIGELI
jgi:hypothetical protein